MILNNLSLSHTETVQQPPAVLFARKKRTARNQAPGLLPSQFSETIGNMNHSTNSDLFFDVHEFRYDLDMIGWSSDFAGL